MQLAAQLACLDTTLQESVLKFAQPFPIYLATLKHKLVSIVAPIPPRHTMLIQSLDCVCKNVLKCLLTLPKTLL